MKNYLTSRMQFNLWFLLPGIKVVDEKDIIPVNTVLCVNINAKMGSNYTGTTNQAEYRIVAASISKAKITVKNPDMDNKNLFPYTGKKVTIDKNNLTIKV